MAATSKIKVAEFRLNIPGGFKHVHIYLLFAAKEIFEFTPKASVHITYLRTPSSQELTNLHRD